MKCGAFGAGSHQKWSYLSMILRSKRLKLRAIMHLLARELTTSPPPPPLAFPAASSYLTPWPNLQVLRPNPSDS